MTDYTRRSFFKSTLLAAILGPAIAGRVVEDEPEPTHFVTGLIVAVGHDAAWSGRPVYWTADGRISTRMPTSMDCRIQYRKA